ncbi:MAG: aspartate aminotransferase family protein, partial [Actinobacteria bacterium]
VTDNWLGGTYASSGMLGTKSGGPIASAWAVMHFLGDDGYLNLTQRAKIATDKLADAIRLNPFVELLASPDALLLAFAAVDASQLDVFSVAQQMWDKGWYLDRQQPPPSLHCTINAVHHDKIEMMISDLNQCIESALNSTQSGDAGQYGTLT